MHPLLATGVPSGRAESGSSPWRADALPPRWIPPVGEMGDRPGDVVPGTATGPITPEKSRVEKDVPAQQSEEDPQARVPGPPGHPRRPRRPPVSPGQGSPQAECVIDSISRRSTFSALRASGRRVRHGSVRLSFLPMQVVAPEIAFAFPRSFGNAVERNRARRRLRAAFRQAWSDAVARVESDNSPPPPMGAYLLTGGRGLLTARFSGIVSDVGRCLDRLSIERPDHHPVGTAS